MNKKIFTINYEIPGHSGLNLDYHSKKSLMDADIVLFDPETPYYERSSVNFGQYLGKTCYGEQGSFTLKEDSNHWKKELKNALNAGKNIFLLLNNKDEFFLDTGERSHTGTGKNRSTTINVAPGHNYEFLPIDIGRIISAQGEHIESKGNPLFQPFFEQFKDDIEYRLYLENLPDSITIFTGKDKSKVLGAVYKSNAGHLVVLPYLNYDDEGFIEYKEEDEEEHQAYWTKEAITFGKKLIKCLLDIDKGLILDTTKTPAPEWVSNIDYCTIPELEISKEIKKLESQIDGMKKNYKKLELKLLEEQALKDLLFEKGKPLELAVTKALKILGYEAENYIDDDLELDQIIISPEKYRYIGECEGKDNKDINITKFRQLVESLFADFDRDEVDEKAFGILFGNPERLKNPNQRKLDFTLKCKTGAEREKIALIKTVDLYSVAKYLVENNDNNFKKLCRKAIHANLGTIVKFPSIPK